MSLELQQRANGMHVKEMKQGQIAEVIDCDRHKQQVGMIVICAYSDWIDLKTGHSYGKRNSTGVSGKDFTPDWIIKLLPDGSQLTVTNNALEE